jgi:hypothetical protein
MESTHTATLYIPELNKAASIVHIFPGMANHSLLSVGQMCNEGYSVTFKIDAVTIYNPPEVYILKGARDLYTGLWRIILRREHQQHPYEVANNVYELHNTGALVNYLHKAMFSPTKSALLQADKNGHIISWPGLTEQAINKHLKLTPTTAMGHMNQRRQNIRSTSKNQSLLTRKMKLSHPLVWEPKLILVCSCGRPRTTLYRSHREISGKIPQMQLVRHGVLRL